MATWRPTSLPRSFYLVKLGTHTPILMTPSKRQAVCKRHKFTCVVPLVGEPSHRSKTFASLSLIVGTVDMRSKTISCCKDAEDAVMQDQEEFPKEFYAGTLEPRTSKEGKLAFGMNHHHSPTLQTPKSPKQFK
eukprot:830267-Amphidinium_carterae.1